MKKRVKRRVLQKCQSDVTRFFFFFFLKNDRKAKMSGQKLAAVEKWVSSSLAQSAES